MLLHGLLRFLLTLSIIVGSFFLYASHIFAHEVYVLNQNEIIQALATTSSNPFLAAISNEIQLVIWGTVTFLLIGFSYLFSVSFLSKEKLQRILTSLKPFANFVLRVTLGLTLLASSYYSSFLGPEHPLSAIFGYFTILVQITLAILGVMIVIGFYTPYVTIITLLVFISAVIIRGPLILMYIAGIGIMLLLIIIPETEYSFSKLLNKKNKTYLIQDHFKFLIPYRFLFVRVFYALSILYASFYAKLIFSNLALSTVLKYQLTTYFPFPPLFIVLGAFIIETIIALFILSGFMLRFTTLVFTIFLILSIIFFREAVWPHIILFGTNFALFIHGYDNYTLGKRLHKGKTSEPIL